MSPQTCWHVGIEWAFARVYTDFAFVDQYKLQKVQLTQISKYYSLAALISNCYTCLYFFQAATYWNCAPPSLAEYFQMDHILL